MAVDYLDAIQRSVVDAKELVNTRRRVCPWFPENRRIQLVSFVPTPNRTNR
jgi:hypothetical protein